VESSCLRRVTWRTRLSTSTGERVGPRASEARRPWRNRSRSRQRSRASGGAPLTALQEPVHLAGGQVFALVHRFVYCWPWRGVNRTRTCGRCSGKLRTNGVSRSSGRTGADPPRKRSVAIARRVAFAAYLHRRGAMRKPYNHLLSRTGVTSRALRLEKQQVTKANKRQIPGLKMLTLLFFNKLGARSTGYARRGRFAPATTGRLPTYPYCTVKLANWVKLYDQDHSDISSKS
jgi:hypothetical protein